MVHSHSKSCSDWLLSSQYDHFVVRRRHLHAPAGVDVQRVEENHQDNAAAEHRDRPEHPQEQRERDVEGPQPERPEEASLVQRSHHVLCRAPVALYRHVHQQAGVAVEPDRLHVEQEGEQEAEEDSEELDGVEVAHQVLAPAGVGAAPGHHGGDERAKRDGRRCQHRRRHDVVPQRLHRQHAVLLRILKKKSV